MISALDHAPRQARPNPSTNPSSLANWTLVRTRCNPDLLQLQSWLANDASADEVGILMQKTPELLYATVEQAVQRRWLSSEQTRAVTVAVGEERACHVATSHLLGATAGTLWHSTSEPLKRADCALSASGAIAGFWACQVHVAASIERALVRLGMRRELLQFKRRHSARCARSLIEWGNVSRIDLQTFPGTHRVASGINAMVDRYCALLTSL
jgi:hypothetical protein